LSQKPHVVRTWAPKGKTPILHCNWNHHKISIMAAMTLVCFFFKLWPRSVRYSDVLGFLEGLLKTIPGKLLIVWDRLPSHRKQEVQQFIAQQGERICVEELPAYCPELNPCEYLFGNVKEHKLPNFCPKTTRELRSVAYKSLYRMKGNEALVQGFWKAAGLW
jgi:transposase